MKMLLVSTILLLTACSQLNPTLQTKTEVVTVIERLCDEFEAVNLEILTRTLDLEATLNDLDTIEQFRAVERNQARLETCASR
jgi:septal ring factor EnvC (AmiA/AmiB activator)